MATRVQLPLLPVLYGLDIETDVKMIEDRTAAGWTFVFLGADPSSYAEAEQLGYDGRSTQHFAADGDGAHAAFADLSRATSSRRGKLRRGESFDSGDYFEGTKSADADREQRGTS